MRVRAYIWMRVKMVQKITTVKQFITEVLLTNTDGSTLKNCRTTKVSNKEIGTKNKMIYVNNDVMQCAIISPFN